MSQQPERSEFRKLGKVTTCGACGACILASTVALGVKGKQATLHLEPLGPEFASTRCFLVVSYVRSMDGEEVPHLSPIAKPENVSDWVRGGWLVVAEHKC